jgi:phenylalanyl-tRNA synthetase beta chain
VDPAAAYAAAHRVAQLLVELAGGTLLDGETVRGSVLPLPTTTMAADLPATVLGAAVDRDTVVRLLTAVGASVTGEEVLSLTAPSWRPDLTDPYDYVEEIGRLVGFDTIPPVLPSAPPGRGLTRAQRARRAVTAALATAGFVEVLGFSFATVEDLDRMGIPAGDERRRLNRIVNPLSETVPYLRTSLLPGLFAAVARNRSRGADDLALFEAGSVFFARDPLRPAPRPPVTGRPAPEELAAMDDALGRQPRHLAAVLCGQRRGGWLAETESVNWTDAVAFVETAAATVGLLLERRAATRAPWHPGRCAELVADDHVLGYAGELHPEVCRSFDLPARTVAAEIDLDALIAAAPTGGVIPLVSGFPVAKEDVALVVAADVPAAAVERALRAGAGPLLESLTLFDVYTGPPVPPGHVSLAYALRFRAPDRTLTDAETAAARDAAVAAAAELTGAVQRTL